jgi:phage tail-like protein
MARAAATDPLHSFRFHAKALGVAGVEGVNGSDVLQPEAGGEGFTASGKSEAGFTSITMPEITLETAEYREGILTYTQKYPGVPTFNDVTLSRGVARFDTSFFNWILGGIEGNQYRTDVSLFHVQRPQRTLARDTSAGTVLGVNDVNSKKVILREALPVRVKPAGDLDASTSDISLAEIDIGYERIDIERPTA